MTDIDFDELDKAVNTLMSDVDVTKRNPSLDDPEDKVLTLAAEPETPSPTGNAPSPSSSESPAVRRGQYMDVIRPSSSAQSVPAPASRQGVAIEPPSQGEGTSIVAPTAALDPVTPNLDEATTLSEVSALESSSALVETITSPTISLDSPASMPANGEAGPSDGLSMPAESSLAPQPTPDMTATVDAATLPLTSPFLPDAKVEKRPLGGMPTEEVTQSAADPAISGQAPGPLQPFPEELHSEVVAVEAGQATGSQDNPENVVDTPVEQSQDMSAVPAAVSSDQTPPANVQEQSPAPEMPATASGNGSILQQYAEQPSSGDQTNGSIYDTATYHQPVEADASSKKPRSSLRWVIWVVVLLIIGAASGAAYFFFTR